MKAIIQSNKTLSFRTFSSKVTNCKFCHPLTLKAYRVKNADVELSHLEIRNEEKPASKNMIVMHGLLGHKLNWRGPCTREEISTKRNCYLVELRNHMSSNHHDEMNYTVISDDIIRFADKHNLEKFSVLGHSLGGRTAMTVACRYPDRVDACISVDAAPINESNDKSFGEFTYSVVSLMLYSFLD
jgi:pimeloyl-ACP methyl ester carboxylesterase